MKVLLVEDDDTLRSSLTSALLSLGHDPHSFDRATPALAAVLQEPFDIIVTDLKLPDLEGIEMIRKTRTEGIVCPFIIITGHANLDVALDSIDLGATAFLRKPFTLTELEQALDKVNQPHEDHEFNEEQAAEEDPTLLQQQVVIVIQLSLEYWTRFTQKSKIQLAMESGLWSVYIDRSTERTRTLDRYLHIDRVPSRPKPALVIRTAQFVLDALPSGTNALELETELFKLKRLALNK